MNPTLGTQQSGFSSHGTKPSGHNGSSGSGSARSTAVVETVAGAGAGGEKLSTCSPGVDPM